MSAQNPYRDPSLNHIYNLMFCDTAALFGAWNNDSTAPIFAQAFTERAVRAIADDPTKLTA